MYTVTYRAMKRAAIALFSANVDKEGKFTTCFKHLLAQQRVQEYITKLIYDELQSTRSQTLRLSVLLTALTSKKGEAQADWDAIVERIHKPGEHGAPLHLKIKAYHVDLAWRQDHALAAAGRSGNEPFQSPPHHLICPIPTPMWSRHGS